MKNERSKHFSHLAILPVFLAAGFLIFFPSLNGTLVFDDLHTIEQNPAIQSISLKQFFTEPSAFSSKVGNWPYRPVVVLSYALDWNLGAGETRAFHITNIIIHSLCAFLIYLVCFSLFKKLPAALAAGFLFMAHPLPGFAVSYLSARSGMLACFFMLASLACWLQWSDEQNRGRITWAVASLILFVLALLSKIDALSLIFVIACLLLFAEKSVSKKFQSGLHFLIIGVCFTVIYKFVSGSLFGAIKEEMIPFHSRGMSVLAGVTAPWIYLSKLVFPANLTIFPALPEPQWVLLALSIAGYLAVLILAIRFQNVKFWLPAVWFFSAILPLALLRLNILLAWHRSYIALAGLFIGLGLLLDFAIEKFRKSAIVLALVVFAILGGASNYQARAWQDPIRLWTEAVEFAPKEFVPHHFLGTLLIKKGNLSQAQKELETAIKLNPFFIDARNSMAALYFMKGDLAAAEEQFQQVCQIDPENYVYLENLIIVKLKLGKIRDLDDLMPVLMQIAPKDDPKARQLLDKYQEIKSLPEPKNPAPEK